MDMFRDFLHSELRPPEVLIEVLHRLRDIHSLFVVGVVGIELCDPIQECHIPFHDLMPFFAPNQIPPCHGLQAKLARGDHPQGHKLGIGMLHQVLIVVPQHVRVIGPHGPQHLQMLQAQGPQCMIPPLELRDNVLGRRVHKLQYAEYMLIRLVGNDEPKDALINVKEAAELHRLPNVFVFLRDLLRRGDVFPDMYRQLQVILRLAGGYDGLAAGLHLLYDLALRRFIQPVLKTQQYGDAAVQLRLKAPQLLQQLFADQLGHKPAAKEGFHTGCFIPGLKDNGDKAAAADGHSHSGQGLPLPLGNRLRTMKNPSHDSVVGSILHSRWKIGRRLLPQLAYACKCGLIHR